MYKTAGRFLLDAVRGARGSHLSRPCSTNRHNSVACRRNTLSWFQYRRSVILRYTPRSARGTQDDISVPRSARGTQDERGGAMRPACHAECSVTERSEGTECIEA